MIAINVLIMAWFLNIFGFGEICIQGSKELFNMNLSISSYYLKAFLGGLVFDVIMAIKMR